MRVEFGFTRIFKKKFQNIFFSDEKLYVWIWLTFTCSFFHIKDKIEIRNMIIKYFSINTLHFILFEYRLRVRFKFKYFVFEMDCGSTKFLCRVWVGPLLNSSQAGIYKTTKVISCKRLLLVVRLSLKMNDSIFLYINIMKFQNPYNH